LWWVQNVVWISLGTAILGLLTLCAGIVLWRNKQIVLDQKDRLEIEKMQRDLSPSTPEQIAESRLEEAGEQLQAQSVTTEDLEPIRPSAMMEAVTRGFQVEKLIADKLRACLSSGNLILTHQQIDRTQYDILLRSGTPHLPDAIFEVKYFSRTVPSAAIQDVLQSTVESTKLYVSKTGRNVVGVVFLVIAKEHYDEEKIERLRQRVNVDFDGQKINFHFITPEDLEQLNCTNFKFMVFGHR
jgi:hypothetical protein